MKGFILKPHEAQALAAGKPVVIWRVCKPQPEFCGADGEQSDITQWGWMTDAGPKFLPVTKCCPFPVGVPLFGKETWAAPVRWNHIKTSDLESWVGAWWRANDERPLSDPLKWRSSTSMPEWASRITLTLSDVKVRRPCDVTEEEAKAMVEFFDGRPVNHYGYRHSRNHGFVYRTARDAFQMGFEIQYGETLALYHFTALATPA